MSFGDIYDVLVAPITTEKSEKQKAEQNKYFFKVNMKATKEDVKKAVETIFGVEVVDVNLLIVEGKTKRFKGREGSRSDVKKAIVTVKKGQEINFGKLE
jgi:large subunit ribosomal protein L23